MSDIAELPRSEQLYLASRNAESDMISARVLRGGQIEAEFTEYPTEQLVLKKLSSEVVDEIFEKFMLKILELDDEALLLIKSEGPAQKTSSAVPPQMLEFARVQDSLGIPLNR